MLSLGTTLRQHARAFVQLPKQAAAASTSTLPRSIASVPMTCRLSSTASTSKSSRTTSKPTSKAQEDEADVYGQILHTLSDSLSMTQKQITRPGEGRMDYTDDLEGKWANRTIHGEASWPGSPYAGRTIAVTQQSDAARAYGQLAVLLRRNNVRNELRLQERYEKPNQERRRKQSERHRRRFADMVRKKVQLVMAIKARGA